MLRRTSRLGKPEGADGMVQGMGGEAAFGEGGRQTEPPLVDDSKGIKIANVIFMP